MIITKTPFRMSFFVGGTDMESFFKDLLIKVKSQNKKIR